ncbi:MAG: NAD(P)/FAD-dependent oxidoreductase [Acidobacteriota bacterium]
MTSLTSAADSYDVAIAGAGPAGTSAAIHLAQHGARVLLVEQKRFPRAKLCGEFISPECLSHFERLGVASQMSSAGGARLNETVFYSCGGHSISVPSEWFGHRRSALGLSRAEMDQKLLQRAMSLGVVVFEGSQVTDLVLNRGSVRGIRVRSDNETHTCYAHVTIDATGQARALVRRFKQVSNTPKVRTRPHLVAFKAHIANAGVADGACEIYSYPGGYGGLSSIEGGLSNFCFIASAKDVRGCDSNPMTVIRRTVLKNSRAAHTLANARPATEWLSVSLGAFGRQSLVPAEGLLTIGDAAAFIDPFTGSGMLMALQSGEVVAGTILEYLGRLGEPESFKSLAGEYRVRYAKSFNSRLRISRLLRHAAYAPRLAEAAILCFGASTLLRRKLALSTRGGSD